MGRRVVVTGMGVVSPVGIGKEEFWKSLTEGKSGIGKMTKIDASGLEVKIAAEIKDFDPEKYGIPKKLSNDVDSFTLYALVAAREALKEAGITEQNGKMDDYGIIIGTGVGGMETLEKQEKKIHEKGPRLVSAKTIPRLMPNAAAGQISIFNQFCGPSYIVSSACASGAHAIADAYKLIMDGDANVVLTGGTEAPITMVGIASFEHMGALTKSWNDEPERASRPFDAKRDGFVIGEGAGMLVIEEIEHAKRRNARIYAEVAGYGMTSDAYHITAPDGSGEGAYRAMKKALEKAGIPKEDVDYINAHGTSTQYNDRVETIAIKRLYEGDKEKIPPISSTKSMTGHMIGAAGGIEGIVSILTIERGIIPPTINYENPDPECDLDYVPNKALVKKVNVVMSNSLGFGGHNCALVFKRYEKD